MSLPFFNLYPRDFEADTSHLTLEEDGAYNRLLRLCWMTPGCSLPDDDAWIMRRMRVDPETYERVVRVVIDEFFIRANGRVSNARLARENAKSGEAHKRRVEAGSKGGKAKALKTNETGPSNAKAKPKQPEPEPEPEIKSIEGPQDGVLPEPSVSEILGEVASPDVVADFIEHRRQMKKPLTQVAAKRMAKRLAECGSADAALSLSIENGWQGVFPEKVRETRKPQSGGGVPFYERILKTG